MSTETPQIEAGTLEMSATIAKLAPAFVRAQRKIRHATKDSENPHFHSKYADLAATFDACREALSAEGFAITQPVSADGRKVRVTTMLLHESGEWMRSTLTLTAAQDTPQAIGSAITYGRRYGLQSTAGVAAEDDDGNAASAPGPQRPRDRTPAKAQRIAEPDPPPVDWLKRIESVSSHSAYDEVRGDLWRAMKAGDAPAEESEPGKALLAALSAKKRELARPAQQTGAGA